MAPMTPTTPTMKDVRPPLKTNLRAYGSIGVNNDDDASSKSEGPVRFLRRDVSSPNAAMDAIDVMRHTGPRSVTYNDKNHLSVMFQMHGSVWPRTFPFCVFNVASTLVIYYLRRWNVVDLTINPMGHKFMAIIMTFLLVSRNRTVLDRLCQARGYLGGCLNSCHELVTYSTLFTMYDASESARKWRRNVAYRTILILRVTLASMEYKNTQKAPWRVPEMSKLEQSEFEELFPTLSEGRDAASIAYREILLMRPLGGNRWAQSEQRGRVWYDALRPPIVLAFELRKTLLSPRDGTVLDRPLKIPEELKLMDQVSDFMKAYHSLIKLIATPVPFPWVQMARTFTMFWIFTLPFALCHNAVFIVQLCLGVFSTTYGYLGLVHVTIEMDDPFGNDPNDFDDIGMAKNLIQGIYATIGKVDGDGSVAILKRMVHKGGIY